VDLNEISSGYKAVIVEPIYRRPMVLLAQDTTFIDLDSEEAVGPGTLKYKKSGKRLLHPMIALDHQAAIWAY